MARTAKVPKSSNATPSSRTSSSAASPPQPQQQPIESQEPSKIIDLVEETETKAGLERTLGEAENTFEGKVVALRLFDKYQTARNYPVYSELTNDDVESDNLQHIIRRFAAWLANFDIPRYYNEKFEPRATTAGLVQYIEPSTKRKYVERVKSALRQKFPKHPDWAEQNEWWTLLMSNFDNEAKRNKMRTHDVTSDRSVRPLYKRNTAGKIQMMRDIKLFRDIDAIDLTYVCKNVSSFDFKLCSYLSNSNIIIVSLKLLKTAGRSAPRNMEHRCQLLTLYNGVGRGGEIKFQQYADWIYDCRFELTDISWHEMKSLQTYSMPITPDSDGYACDWYHSLGCYYAVERGLYRANKKSTGVSDFVFPKLHKLRDKSISKTLTTVIRDNLPTTTPPKLKKSFSSKSVRKGGIGELSMHRDVSFFESCVRSGHSIGSNQDHYVDRCNLAIALPGGLAINEWPDAHGKVQPPRLSCLPSTEVRHALEMVAQLFVITHCDFLPDGVLRPVLVCAFATLLMYYAQTVKECGMDHCLTVCMLNAGIKVGIRSHKNHEAHNVLMEWSDVILRDFRQRNARTKITDSSKIIPVLNTMCESMTNMNTKMTDMINALADNKETIRSLQQQLANVERAVNNNNNKVNRKMTMLRTPPSVAASTPTSSTPINTGMNQKNNNTNDDSDDSPQFLQTTQASCTSSSTYKRSRKRKLTDILGKDHTVLRTEGGGSATKKNKKAESIAMIIANAHQAKAFVNGVSLVDVVVPGAETERRKFEDTMRLTQWLLNDVELEKLTNADMPRMDVCHIGNVVQERVLRHVAALEKKKEWNSSRMRATFAAVGARLQKLKKNGVDFYFGAEGTPTQNKSIRSMFKRGPADLFTQPEHREAEAEVEVLEEVETEQGG